jgi:hypothetical protein
VLSFSLFFLVIIYAYKIFNDLNNRSDILASTTSPITANQDTPESIDATSELFDEDAKRNVTFKTIYRTVTNEPWCIWVANDF